MSERPPGSQPEQYWSSAEYPAWSQQLVFPPGGLSYEQFRFTVITAAEQLVPGHRFTGFITHDPQTGNVGSFTRTIYPRRKYPVMKPEECPRGMVALERLFVTTGIDARLQADTTRAGSFRTILGLFRGQRDYYDQPTDHSVDQIQALLRGRGLLSDAQLAEVFTVRFTPEGTTTYFEPVALLRGPLEEIEHITNLEIELGQERFSVERFYADRPATVQMVETYLCQEPEFH